MTRLLSLFGLMRVSEHDAACRPLRERLFDSEQKRIHWQGQSNEMTAKFKQAVADLEKQAGEIAALKRSLAESEMLGHSLDAERSELIDLAAGRLEIINTMAADVLSLRPDAEAMRKKRDADRKRMAGKRGKA